MLATSLGNRRLETEFISMSACAWDRADRPGVGNASRDPSGWCTRGVGRLPRPRWTHPQSAPPRAGAVSASHV